MKTTLLWCFTPYLCGGVVVSEDNRIIEAAPILGWLVGKRFADLEWYLHQKRGGYRQLPEEYEHEST